MNKYKSALVIDDDYDLCMLLKAILEVNIPVVHCATTLEMGKKMLNEVKPDVIFIDNNLPDGRGVDFIVEIKAYCPDCLVIAISAIENSKETALMNGAAMFLEKPLSPATINKALGIVKE